MVLVNQVRNLGIQKVRNLVREKVERKLEGGMRRLGVRPGSLCSSAFAESSPTASSTLSSSARSNQSPTASSTLSSSARSNQSPTASSRPLP